MAVLPKQHIPTGDSYGLAPTLESLPIMGLSLLTCVVTVPCPNVERIAQLQLSFKGVPRGTAP